MSARRTRWAGTSSSGPRPRRSRTPRAATCGAAPAPERRCGRTSRRFARRRIVPRMLRDVAERDLSATVLGAAMPAPVLLAPIGVQVIVHPEGELASAAAAGEVGLPYVASTAAAHSLEEIAQAGGDAPRWYQLYWPKDEAVTESLVRRAEAAGYGAIVAHPRHDAPGLAALGPRSRVPAVPAGPGHRRSSSPIRRSAPPSSARPRRTCRPRWGSGSAWSTGS